MTAINDVVDLALEGDVAVITIDSPPVNALSAAVRDGLAGAFSAAIADEAATAIVLICAGRTFIAGADISEFGKPPRGANLHEVLDGMERAPKPIVAAIHGTALGGGLETALACHYRLAVPAAKLGLPEVKLGLLPGAGGTQRLPRVVGAEAALQMMTSGDPVSAQKALDAGLLDEIVGDGDLRRGAIQFARQVVAERRPLNKISDREVTADTALFERFRSEGARKFRGFQAPEAIIKCVEAACTLPFEEGMKRERELFMGLMTGTQSAAQRHIFFAERQAAKIKNLPEGTRPRNVAKVGVIGAGTMGGGIAMNYLSAGTPVTIVETAEAALQRGVGIMRKNYEASAARGSIKPEAVAANMDRLNPTLDLSALADCDLIIEAVFENMAIKKELFSSLDTIAKPGAILATNTSYLNVDEIAAATSRPHDVVGMHFFSPANVMKLLEVVRGAKTAPDVLATAVGIAKPIGKIAVVSGVCDGFIGNRMLAPRQQQANALILEGAMPWDVDRVLYDFGFPMGPFQMADLAGLDIGWSKESSKGETIRDRLCDADRRGQKTGSGFYDYDDRRNRSPSRFAEETILAMANEKGIRRRSVSDQEILERCIYPMINEGAKILEEGMAQRPSDIDVVWVYGYGWPRYRGGPMFFADTEGVEEVLDVLEKYQDQGEAFRPAELLVQLVEEGRYFGDMN